MCSERSFLFATAFDLNKCLKQIKYQICSCAVINELPSNISTMRHNKYIIPCYFYGNPSDSNEEKEREKKRDRKIKRGTNIERVCV